MVVSWPHSGILALHRKLSWCKIAPLSVNGLPSSPTPGAPGGWLTRHSYPNSRVLYWLSTYYTTKLGNTEKRMFPCSKGAWMQSGWRETRIYKTAGESGLGEPSLFWTQKSSSGPSPPFISRELIPISKCQLLWCGQGASGEAIFQRPSGGRDLEMCILVPGSVYWTLGWL